MASPQIEMGNPALKFYDFFISKRYPLPTLYFIVEDGGVVG